MTEVALFNGDRILPVRHVDADLSRLPVVVVFAADRSVTVTGVGQSKGQGKWNVSLLDAPHRLQAGDTLALTLRE